MTRITEKDLERRDFWLHFSRAERAVNGVLKETASHIALDDKTVLAYSIAIEALTKAALLRADHLKNELGEQSDDR